MTLSLKKKSIFSVFAIALGVFAFSQFSNIQKTSAAGPVSGTVFRDYNGNGTRELSNPVEPGVRGVIVNVYDSSGFVTSATSGANGAYNIPSVTGNVRIEFIIPETGCDLDAGGTFSGTSGSVYGTSVRFVSEGATGVNFAVSSPSEYYTTDNPNVGLSVLNSGNPTGGGSAGTRSGFEVFAYNTNSDTPVPSSRATTAQIGSVWGNAYSSQANRYFVSTVIKRHAGTGPLGGSGIYMVNPNTAASGSSFIDLSAVGVAASNTGGTYPYNDGRLPSGTNNQAIAFNDVVGANTGGAGTRHRGLPLNVSPWTATDYSSYDAAAFEQAGKLSFGGLEISGDGRYLYTVNLYTKALVRIDLRNPQTPQTPTAAQVTSYPIPDPVCVGGSFRPWAAKFFRGKVYVGGICDAQSSQVAANLRAYVYVFNTATLSFEAVPIVNGYSLTYTKGTAITIDDGTAVPVVSNRWYPWTNNYNTLLNTFASQNTKLIRPQPILADIDFDDADGSLILAFMDRTGLQTGYRNWGPRDVQADLQSPSSSATNGTVEVGGGDVLRFYKNPTGCTFDAESGGVSNGVSGSGAGNNQGPGGGEFFGAESYNTTTHAETAVGALAVNYGSRAVMATNYDAFNTGGVNAGGVRRFDMANGGLVSGTNGYNVYNQDSRGITFAKGVGIGDIEMLTAPAPIEVGNRVWNDLNGDGIQGASEVGFGGVTVQLWADTNGDGTVDTLVGTAVTNAAGEYYFVGSTSADPNTTDHIGQVNGGILPNTAYQVRIPSSNFASGQPLHNRVTALANNDGSANGDSRDSDGISTGGAGSNVVVNFTTGGAGQNNHTYDFGFRFAPTAAVVPVAGRIQAADGRGIRNVVVTLTNANGQSVSTRTGAFGYYRFEDVEVGQSITVSVRAKRFTFSQPTRVISLEDAIEDLDFTADGVPLRNSKVTASDINGDNQKSMK